MAQAPEHELIHRYFLPLAGPQGLGLVDDAAILAPAPGRELVVTSDMVAEGVHFLDDAPEAIAAKALRVNLSDLAAKGAEPVGYTLALGLSDSCDEAWVARFAAGLAADQERFGIRLVGGDTTRSGGGIVIAVTAFGSVPAGAMVRRSTAQVGDVIFVTGTIGDAALGLLARKGRTLGSAADSDYLRQRYLYPEPRLALAPVLRRHASAAMDVSDGLAGDLVKLCAASGLAAEIDVAAVPLSSAARAAVQSDPGLLEMVLTGGDDYEILLTVRAGTAAGLLAAAVETGVGLTAIGQITVGAGAAFIDRMGRSMTFKQTAYDHFVGQGP